MANDSVNNIETETTQIFIILVCLWTIFCKNKLFDSEEVKKFHAKMQNCKSLFNFKMFTHRNVVLKIFRII